ncbi:hypothetical protein ES703_76732 [subsurface metagenome]
MSREALPIDRVYRLDTARRYFLEGHWDEPTGKKYYENWRDSPEYMMGEKWRFEKKVDGNYIHRERVSWRLAKRGDYLYKKNLRDRVKWVFDLPNTAVFNPKDRVLRHKTHFLFITDTTALPENWKNKQVKYDTWKEESAVNNRRIQRLRNHYGDIQYFRMNEGTKKGYPTPHGVYYFPEKEWTVYRDRKGKWRLINSQWRELKGIIEGKDSRAKPVLGFSDVEGIWNPGGAIKYLVNYLVGEPGQYAQGHVVDKLEAQDRTWFWLWLTRKHTYSGSRDFKASVMEYLDYTRLDTGGLGISKVVWVYLKVGGGKEANAWDNDHLPALYPGQGTHDGLIRRALRNKTRIPESLDQDDSRFLSRFLGGIRIPGGDIHD